MNELLLAFENAIRRIVQEELAKKSNDFDFIKYIDENADKFDKAVMSGLESNSTFIDIVQRTVDNCDIDDTVKEAVRKLTFTTEVSRY